MINLVVASGPTPDLVRLMHVNIGPDGPQARQWKRVRHTNLTSSPLRPAHKSDYRHLSGADEHREKGVA